MLTYEDRISALYEELVSDYSELIPNSNLTELGEIARIKSLNIGDINYPDLIEAAFLIRSFILELFTFDKSLFEANSDAELIAEARAAAAYVNPPPPYRRLALPDAYLLRAAKAVRADLSR